MADYAGLQYQVQSLRVSGGKMEAVDDWLLEPPQNRAVTNGRFDTSGVIGKRFGQTSLDGSAIDTTSGPPHAIYPAKGVLYAATSSGTYVRDDDADTWFQTGLTSPRITRAITDSLVRQNGTVVAPDVAFVGDIGCVVWSEQLDEDRTLFSCFYQFFDANTLAVLSGPTQIVDGGYAWDDTVLITGNETAGCFWIVGTYGSTYRIGSYLASANDYTFTFAARGTTFQAEDIISFQNEAIVLAKSGSVTAFESWSTTPALGWQQVTGQGHLGLAVCHNSVSGQFVSLAGNGDVALCDDDGLSTPTVTTCFTVPSHVSGSGAPTARSASISQLDDSGNMVAFIAPPFNVTGSLKYPRFNVSGATEWGTYIGTCDSGAAITNEQYLPVISLIGRAARDTDGRVLVPVAHLQQAAEVYGSMCAVVPSDPSTYPSLSEVARFGIEKVTRLNKRIGHSVVHSSKVKFAYNVVTEVERASLVIKNQQMVDLVQVEATYAPRYGLVNGDTAIAGGVPSLIDGSRHYEASVAAPIAGLPTPNAIGYTAGSDKSLSITANTSAVSDPAHIRVVYRFIDANGNIIRSAPSEDYIVFSANVSAHDPACRVVSKPFPTAIDPVERYLRWDLELHTEDTGGGWGFLGVVTPKDAADATTPPDFAEQLVFFVAETAAAPTGQDSRHYIQLGSFEKPAPGAYPTSWFESREAPGTVPPLVDIVSVQDRLWGLNGEGRQQLRYTNPFEFGAAPEWPTWGSVQIPPDGGEAVAITAIDDKVVILKKNRAYRVFGDPGTASGTGSSLQTPALISSDVGCVDARTVVEGPWGTVFLSERGFYKLGRDLSMEFIGEPVKDTTVGLTFAAGVLVPSQSQVRWPILADTNNTDAASTLVWDYRQNAWTLWTNETAQHAAVVDGVYHRLLRDTATVYKETPDVWTTLPGLFSWAVQTGWVHLAGNQGYQRLKEMLFLFRYYSGVRITIVASYDYDDTKTDTWVWDDTTIDTLVTSGGRLQLRVKPSYRKCESVRFSFLEQSLVGESSDQGRGVDLIGVDLVVGSKRSAWKAGLAAGAKQ